jgi:transposase-like protein
MADSLNLSRLAKYFSDEDAARALLEKMRWGGHPTCPRCGGLDPYKITPKATTKTTRKGLYKCSQCRKPFTVTVGTVFEDSHIPISKWLLAMHLMCASKKGMSAHQLHRMLDVTYKSAWFMAHRLRYAMMQPAVADKLKGIIEVDETYVGGKRQTSKGQLDARRGHPAQNSNKTPVVALVQRQGNVRAFPMMRVTSENLSEAIFKHVDRSATLMTDEMRAYEKIGRKFAKHETVTHARNEYVRGDAHTNTVEGFFSLLKRGINGTYHHVGRGHLNRYCDEFSFRYNARKVDDGTRTGLLVAGAEGKRLTYKQPAGIGPTAA